MSGGLSRADIVVGIPSLNEADNIAFVAEQLSIGLKKYYPTSSSIIINVDNNSQDGTKDAFLSSSTGDIPKKYITTGEGVLGKGSNLRNLFIEVEKFKPKAVIIVDADLKSITPEWVETLGQPIMNGYDYVTPIYSRHHYDGTITNHICYPLLYGLFKANIRQPIAGDFSFSPKMSKYWLNMEWNETTNQYGIDIFMTSAALLNGFKCCQVVLGAKIHKPSAPKLGPMFTQVVTTLFDHLSKYRRHWMNGIASKECPVIGEYSQSKPQDLSVDYKTLKNVALEGFKEHNKIISSTLSPSHYDDVKRMYLSKEWHINPQLWVKILYDFLYSYERAENKGEIVEALKPLYFARAASFYNQTINSDHLDAEEQIKTQALECRKMKNYVVGRFNEGASMN
jgi:glycosyltransferase involved in cell wall biosynthesis